MTNTTSSTRHVELGPRSRPPTRSRPHRGRRVLGWAGATALVATGVALGTATFTGDRGAQVQTPGRQERARVPACVWTTEVDSPVFPAEDLGAAPNPSSVLVFEACDGEWTGDIAWMDSGRDLTHSSDDGLPNAWEAGNSAVAPYLDEADRP